MAEAEPRADGSFATSDEFAKCQGALKKKKRGGGRERRTYLFFFFTSSGFILIKNTAYCGVFKLLTQRNGQKRDKINRRKKRQTNRFPPSIFLQNVFDMD
jgi:hypothetical protein